MAGGHTLELDPQVALKAYKESKSLRAAAAKIKALGIRNSKTGKPLSHVAVWNAIMKTKEGSALAARRSRRKRQSRALRSGS